MAVGLALAYLDLEEDAREKLLQCIADSLEAESPAVHSAHERCPGPVLRLLLSVETATRPRERLQTLIATYAPNVPDLAAIWGDDAEGGISLSFRNEAQRIQGLCVEWQHGSLRATHTEALSEENLHLLPTPQPRRLGREEAIDLLAARVWQQHRRQGEIPGLLRQRVDLFGFSRDT